MPESAKLRDTKLALRNGTGALPALGFGTLIPDPVATKNATKAALQIGFRALDTAERYRTESEVGEAIKEVLGAGEIRREDLFIITKTLEHQSSPGAGRSWPSRPASTRSCSSTTSISISSTPRSPFNPETRKTQGMRTAMSSMTKE